MTSTIDSAIVSTVWAETRNRPPFLGTGTPALSWQVLTDEPNWLQAESEIEVRLAGVVAGRYRGDARSQNVPWPAEPLTAYDSAEVRVRVRGGARSAWSEYSAWLTLRTGPLGAADWTAPFIAAQTGPDEVDGVDHHDSADPDLRAARPTVRFRTPVTLDAAVASAVLSVTAHGVYEAVINGQTVGDEVLAPGWTSYDSRLTFQSYDVTDLLREGPNVLGVTVADGWYRERFGFDGKFAIAYPGPLALSAQLRIVRADGHVEIVLTDESWSAGVAGPTTSASIYQGETYDARLEDHALTDAAVELPDAVAVTLVETDAARLVASVAPPVRRIESVPAVAVTTSPSGKTLVDFGQNLVGWVELSIDAPAGTTITLRHAEVLEHGELGVRPLRFAAATDHYTSAGTGPVRWSPRFTFHGFRYLEVTGVPGEPTPEQFTAIVVHNDMLRTGELLTSNPKLNQLHDNVRWGMRGNFLSLPTDCPQRDERLGWTGDIQVFTPTASYLYDTSSFLASWLADLACEQERHGGVVPIVVPSPLTGEVLATAAWGDAATLVPDALFERFGDARILQAQYASMRDWVETVSVRAGANRLWSGGFQFGDWLDPSAPPENPAAAKTDSDIVATAYFFRSTQRLAAAAEVLGYTADTAHYTELAEEIRQAFMTEYVTDAARLVSDAHTAYALAIGFGLITDPVQVRKAGRRLAELVRAHGYRIRTGFVGTPLITDALCLGGETAVAYRLLLEEGCPSWLYPVSMGATTIWERWDSIRPDGSINPGEMTSFNHYALGAVADWMHRTIGGIAPAAPGYRTVSIAPIPGGGLTQSAATLETGFGTVSVEWTHHDGQFTLHAVVPPNSMALVTLPGSDQVIEIGSGEHRWTMALAATDGANAAQRPVTMTSTLAEIMDDDEARSLIERTFAQTGYFIGLGWTSSGRWRTDSVLGQSLPMFSDENKAALETALAELNAVRAGLREHSHVEPGGLPRREASRV